MATLGYSIDLSRLEVVELDNNKKISEFNNIVYKFNWTLMVICTI
jgi:hypothetical protein